jgi:hypothetical protein
MEQKICVFRDVYNDTAARSQAEEKKTAAFGTLAALKIWDRPKDQDISLTAAEKRYEPFWYVKATRHAVYNRKAVYQIMKADPNAVSVTLLGQDCQFTQGRFIELQGVEHCNSLTTIAEYFEGLNLKGSDLKLVDVVDQYPFDEIESSDAPEFVMPELTAATVIQQVKHRLMQPIEAEEMLQDDIEVSAMTLFFRPVYAFDFLWRDKHGIVEIDGLTGKVSREGNMLHGMVRKLGARETLFDIGSEIAGVIIPGGNVVVKAIGRLTKE